MDIKKNIALLAIGNELVEGQIQDTNSYHFAGIISAQGGTIRHQRQVTDHLQDIMEELRSLLTKNDAVIITGGLGPTSDDKTRHAIGEALNLPLYFDEPSWEKIQARLTQFGLAIAPSNRQQALFPEGSTIIENDQGSARGAHMQWNKKDIFMLPGPPNECWPMFDSFVLPYLQKNEFFKINQTLRFLTIGLVEGEIAPIIDEIAKPFGAETGYRWTYPYIEIKLKSENPDIIEHLHAAILNQIKPNLVSTNDNNAFDVLKHELSKENTPMLSIEGHDQTHALVQIINHPKLIHRDNNHSKTPWQIKLSANKMTNLEVLNIQFNAYMNGELTHTHMQTTPFRNTRVHLYIEHYCAWQISQLLKQSKPTQP